MAKMTVKAAYQKLIAYALTFPEAHLDHPWGHDAVKVGKKMFATFGGEEGGADFSMSVKLPARWLLLPELLPDGARIAIVDADTGRTAYADDEHRPNLLAAAAWLSWALGRSTHAAIFADLALAVDADHGMSQIVATFVASGHLASWVFVRP